MIPKQFDACNKKYCASERVEKCDICNRTICEDCAKVKKCSTRSKNFCVYCREVNYLSCCKEQLCAACMVPSNYADCSKNFRKGQVEKCGACDKLLCNECRSQRCGACLKSFCDDDCRFVDSCEQCEVSYCGDCATVVRIACCKR